MGGALLSLAHLVFVGGLQRHRRRRAPVARCIVTPRRRRRGAPLLAHIEDRRPLLVRGVARREQTDLDDVDGLDVGLAELYQRTTYF